MVLNLILLNQICTTLGCRNFEDTPQWHLNNTILGEEAAVTYVGTVLSNNTKHHIDTKIKAAHRAFYGLQSAGLCANGVSPIVSAHTISIPSTWHDLENC